MSPLSPLPHSGQLSGGEPEPRRRARLFRRAATAAVVVLAAGLGAWSWLSGAGSDAGRSPVDQLARLASGASPTPTGRPSPPTRAPTRTATPWSVTTGTLSAPPPFFAFGRPFDPPDLALPAASYLYGTDAEGSLLLHHGVDLGAPTGTSVVSIGDGTVAYAGTDDRHRFGPDLDFYGRLVIIRHGEPDRGGPALLAQDRLAPDHATNAPAGAAQGHVAPLFSLYGHLSASTVHYGQRVRRGQVIGAVGTAGIALGPHLHLELRTTARDYGATRNPVLYMASVPGTGAVVARAVDSLGRPLVSALVGLFALEPSERWVAQARSYPSARIHPSTPWDENLAFSDLPPGRYALTTEHHSKGLRTEFTVPADGVVFAVLSP